MKKSLNKRSGRKRKVKRSNKKVGGARPIIWAEPGYLVISEGVTTTVVGAGTRAGWNHEFKFRVLENPATNATSDIYTGKLNVTVRCSIDT